MDPHLPAVTVVIPTHNRWHFLERTLGSALGQVGVDHEIVVIDDGSTDETAIRLAEIEDPRVRVFRNASATGVSRARNRGIGEARGEWVAFLDDDDLWSPQKLRLHLEAARIDDADFVYGSAVEISEEGAFLEERAAPPPSDVYVRLLRFNVIPAGASSMMARRELLVRVGGFDEMLFHLADWDLWIRLAAAGRAGAVEDPLVAYVRHPMNMITTSGERDIFAELHYLADKHRAAGEAAGVAVDRVGVSRWLAYEHERGGRRVQAVRTYLRGAVAYRGLGNVLQAAAATFLTRPRHRRRKRRKGVLPAWVGGLTAGSRADADGSEL